MIILASSLLFLLGVLVLLSYTAASFSSELSVLSGSLVHASTKSEVDRILSEWQKLNSTIGLTPAQVARLNRFHNLIMKSMNRLSTEMTTQPTITSVFTSPPITSSPILHSFREVTMPPYPQAPMYFPETTVYRHFHSSTASAPPVTIGTLILAVSLPKSLTNCSLDPVDLKIAAVDAYAGSPSWLDTQNVVRDTLTSKPISNITVAVANTSSSLPVVSAALPIVVNNTTVSPIQSNTSTVSKLPSSTVNTNTTTSFIPENVRHFVPWNTTTDIWPFTFSTVQPEATSTTTQLPERPIKQKSFSKVNRTVISKAKTVGQIDINTGNGGKSKNISDVTASTLNVTANITEAVPIKAVKTVNQKKDNITVTAKKSVNNHTSFTNIITPNSTYSSGNHTSTSLSQAGVVFDFDFYEGNNILALVGFCFVSASLGILAVVITFCPPKFNCNRSTTLVRSGSYYFQGATIMTPEEQQNLNQPANLVSLGDVDLRTLSSTGTVRRISTSYLDDSVDEADERRWETINLNSDLS